MEKFATLVRFIWRSSKRAAVLVIGLALLAVGLVMFVTPGPGIVLVVAGLAVLATEFAWAEHLLTKAREQAARAGQSAQRVPGVAQVTATAGRLVPRRWRRTTATEVVVSETTADGVVTGRSATISSTTITSMSLSADGGGWSDAAPDPGPGDEPARDEAPDAPSDSAG